MPIDPNNFTRSSNENTMSTIAGRTCDITLRRLKTLYSSTINFEHCFLDICNFLKAKISYDKAHGITVDMFHEAEVALRSLYPTFGAIACNAERLETIAYYWMAANDEDPKILSSTIDRRANFLRAMYECQRGNNAIGENFDERNSAVVNFEDNRNDEDWTICNRGIKNKFPERFVGMHYAVDFIVTLNSRIEELVSAFLAEYFYAHGKSFFDLVVHYERIYSELVTPKIKAEIRDKVIYILGIANQVADGLMGEKELKLLDDCLQNLEYYRFYVARDPDLCIKPKIMEKSFLARLIQDANRQYHEAKHVRIDSLPRFIFTFAYSLATGALDLLTDTNKINFSAIINLLSSQVPCPNNTSIIYIDNGHIERVKYSGATKSNNDISNIRGEYAESVRRNQQSRLQKAMGPQSKDISAEDADKVRKARLDLRGF